MLLLGGSLVAGTRPGGFTHNVLIGLIGSTFGVSLAALVMLPRVRRPKRLAGAQLAFDLVVVTGLVYLFGGALSGFSFLYGVVILASALLLGPRATQWVTAAALVLYLGVGWGLASEWIAGPPDASPATEVPLDVVGLSVLRTLVGLILVGLLAGGLAERLRRTGGQLKEVTLSAAKYAKLNEDILRSMASGLLTTDLDGTIVRINRAGAALFGGSRESLEGTRADLVLPFDPAVDQEVDRGDGLAERVDGSTFPIGYGCSPLRDEQGQLQGTLVLFSDLSELKMLREKATRAERLAALGKLSAGLAHEIRNPLGSISGSVELVREAPSLDEEDRGLLTLVLTEVDRLDGLVTTMLDVGRPREPVFSTVDVGALAEDVARVIRGGTAIGIEIETTDGPVLANADSGQLRQVIWNLLKNAIQFSPPEHAVTVMIDHSPDARPRISVRDEGPGIPAEDAERVFDVFFSKRHQGVGLGLALVKQIVQAHGGSVEVLSEPGQGSTFRVLLEPEKAGSASAGHPRDKVPPHN